MPPRIEDDVLEQAVARTAPPRTVLWQRRYEMTQFAIGSSGNLYLTYMDPEAWTVRVLMVGKRMLKTKRKRLTDRSVRAVERLAKIETSIIGLADEDLLDLADIFTAEPRAPIGDMAFLEMARRNISL